MIKNLLLTGSPATGKSTLIRRLSEVFKEFNPAGFYTLEIREDGQVTGYSVTNLFGDSKILAHVSLKSKQTVGKYHVDVKGFEIFLDAVFSKEKKTGLFILDEINRMSCLSRKFSKLVIELLNEERPVIASIPERGTGLITEIRKREDVRLVEVTPYNRDLKLKELTMEIRDLLLE